MRVVIDSNCLRSTELRWFLSQDAAHLAVIADYAWIEAYNGDSLVSIAKSLKVLSQFPDQVLLLKGTKAVGALKATVAGMADSMIIPKSRKEFRKTAAAVDAMNRGDDKIAPALLRHETVAKDQMQRVLRDASDLSTALLDVEGLFTPEERKSIRIDSAYSESVITKTIVVADQLYHRLRHAHPAKPHTAPKKRRLYAFLFRFALACVIYNITWIRHGSHLGKKPELIRNDLVDLVFASYGTYFNGIMTRDKRLQEIHTELRTVLAGIGALLPRAYDATPFLLFGPEDDGEKDLAAA